MTTYTSSGVYITSDSEGDRRRELTTIGFGQTDRFPNFKLLPVRRRFACWATYSPQSDNCRCRDRHHDECDDDGVIT
jgi:hypothetical protein